MGKTIGTWTVTFAILALAAVTASQSPWEKATADQLAKFLPGPVQGLIPQLPWDPKDFNQPGPVEDSWSREEIGSNPEYQPVGVAQRWRINDPALIERVNKAEKSASDSMSAKIAQAEQGPGKDEEEMERKLNEIEQKIQKASEAGNVAELQKLQKEYQEISSTASNASRKLQQIQKEPGRLRESARWLRLVIQANLMPRGAEIWGAGKSKGKAPQASPPPAATVKGYPVGRSEYGPSANEHAVTFTIYLGPSGLNTTSDTGPRLRQEVKAIFVMAAVRTDQEHKAADEALALKMLESTDFEGLAGLVKK